MTKKTTQKVIDSTSYLISYSDDPGKVISEICKTYQLTHDFVSEFYPYITKEMFTLSYKLLPELADQFEELFDENILFDAIEEFYKDESEDELKLETPGNEESEKEIKTPPVMSISNLSLSMYIRYLDKVKEKDELLVEGSEPVYYSLRNILREADQEEFTDSLSLLGLSTETDQILLQRINDPNLRNAILLAISCDDERAKTSASFKYMSNELKENVIGTSDVDPKDFISGLADSTDFVWILSMLKKAVNGEIQFEKSTKSFDREMVLLLNKLPEDQIIKLASLSKYMPIAFSSTVLTWLLKNKELNEEQLIEMKELFKKAGLGIALRKFAAANNYNKLLENF